jgi:hypothetical protein
MSSVQLHSSDNSSLSHSFTFKKISRKSETELNNLSVLEILNQSNIVNVIETGSFDFPNFPEAKKSFQVLYFELDSAFLSKTPLFKSIVSLGKPEGVILEINKDLGNYTLKYYATNADIVKSYLQKIFGIFEDELSFKTILRRVLENQARNKMEEQLLQKELFSA